MDVKYNLSLLVLFEVIFFASVMIGATAKALSPQASAAIDRPALIFLNNFMIALVMVVPVIGLLFACFHVALAGCSVGASRGLAVALAFFSYPHVHLELFSYTFFVMAGNYILMRRFSDSVMSFLVGTVLLLLSAIVEYLTFAVILG